MLSKLTRISPAMGVALIALVLSLGGTSFAKDAAARLGKAISGARVKRNSLPGDRLVKGSVKGDRIRANSITGAQIDERTLAQVPSAKKVAVADRATNAQRATNADNALALGGTAAAGFVTYGKAVIPSGATVTGAFGVSGSVATATAPLGADLQQVVQLPGAAPADITSGAVNFAPGTGTTDADGSCSGSAATPTAPPGRVCLYLTGTQGDGTLVEGTAIPGLPGSRAGFVVHAVNPALSTTGAFGTWAYTAP